MGGGGTKKAIQMDQNYNFPIIALKALTQYQPRDYHFAIEGRTLFDISKYPKGIKVLNGDISEDAAKYQAKTLVDQLQSQKAHAQYHMIQQITSEEDVSDTELLHVPNLVCEIRSQREQDSSRSRRKFWKRDQQFGTLIWLATS
jgi:hypothetical protein